MFVLQIDYQRLSSPAAAGVNPEDRREVSVFLRSLTVQAGGGEEFIDFSLAGRLKNHALFGFWPSEREGAWSNGWRSALVFEQLSAGLKKITLHLDGNCLTEAFDACRLTFVTSGGHRGSLIVAERQTRSTTLTRPVIGRVPPLVVGNFRRLHPRNNVSLLPDNPLLSVIIPNYQKPLLTRLAAIALASSQPGVPYEILCVDNGSSRENVGKLREAEVPMRVIELKENLGFGPANNLAVQEARGRFVLLLNNDAFLSTHAIPEMMRAFKADPRCGAVAPVLRDPGGAIQEAGCSITRDGYPVRLGRADASFKLNRRPRFQAVEYASGACLMMDRKVFLDSGGFDPVFAPAYYEDTDLCLKLGQRGLHVYVAKDALCYHIENATSGDFPEHAWASSQAERNRQLFLQRWGHVLDKSRSEPHGNR